MAKDLEMGYLLDFYGEVLTEKQREMLRQYYNDDLSLSEIGENFGITRQGARDAIKHGEAALDELEAQLGNARRHAQMQEDLARLHQLVMEIRCCNSGLFNPVPRIRTDTDEMLKIIERLDAQEEPDGV